MNSIHNRLRRVLYITVLIPLLLSVLWWTWMSFAQQKGASLRHQRDVAQLSLTEIECHLMCIEREMFSAFHGHDDSKMALDKRRSILADIFSRYDSIVSLAYFDASGKELIRIAANDEIPSGLSCLGVKPSLLRSLQKKESSFCLQPNSEGEEGYLVSIFTPSISLFGNRTGGSLVARVRLSSFLTFLNYYKTEPGVTLYVVDERGKLVDYWISEKVEPSRVVFENPQEVSGKTVLKNGTKVFRAMVEKRYNGLTLYFIVQRPVKDVVWNSLVFQMKIWAVLFVIVAGILLRGDMVLSQIIDPLRKLRDEARNLKVKAGQRVGGETADEVGQLATTINKLLDALQVSSLSLERETRARGDADKQLAYFQNFFQRVIDQLPELIVYKDRDGGYIGSNKAAVRLIGEQRQEEPESLAENDSLVLQTGLARRVEGWVQYSGGRRVLLDTVTTPISIENSELSGLVRVSSDVTVAKANESELANLRVLVRDLREMEAVGVFAAGIAHDFNNFLGAILGYTEMVMEELPAESQAVKDLQNVIDAGMQSKVLVRQILAFARRTDSDDIVINPVSLVKELVKRLRENLSSSIDLEVDLDPDCALIAIEPSQFYQLFTQLCDAAAEVIGQKTGGLRVVLGHESLREGDSRLEPEANPGEYLKLEVSSVVSDMEEQLHRHFEPFYGAKTTSSVMDTELTQVRQIVCKNHGLLFADGDSARGTRVRVYFPTVSEDEE